MNAHFLGTDEVKYGIHTVEYQLLKRVGTSIASRLGGISVLCLRESKIQRHNYDTILFM